MPCRSAAALDCARLVAGSLGVFIFNYAIDICKGEDDEMASMVSMPGEPGQYKVT